MRPTPYTFLPILVAGAAVCIALSTAKPVEARSNGVAVEYSRRVFSKATLPTEDDLAALQSGAVGQVVDPPLPDGKGKDLALKYCVTCHASTVWSRQHHTPEQWNSLIDNMVSKGLTAPDEDLATISDYLAANFGPLKKDPPPPAQ